MKVEFFQHTDVNPDGTFKNKAGAVITGGNIRLSRELFKISFIQPITSEGNITGVSITFANRKEMQTFFKTINTELL